MASPAAEWLPKKLSWGAIPTPRAFHLAFARGANLYVFGGTTESPGPNELFALYCLNTKSMTWTDLICTGAQPPLASRSRSTCCVDGDKLYCLDPKLNASGKIQSIDLFILDLLQYTWSSKPTTGSPPLCLGESGVACVNGKIWTFGGTDVLGTFSNTMKSLDLTTLAWHQETSYDGPTPRAGFSMASQGNNLIVCGGRTYSVAVPYPILTVYCFDTDTKKWRDTKPAGNNLPSSREGMGLGIWGTQAIFFGGYNSRASTDFNDVYSLETEGKLNETTAVPFWKDFTAYGRTYQPKERRGASVTIIGNTAWIFGGVKDIGPPQYFNDTHSLRLSTEAAGEDTSFLDSFLADQDSKPEDDILSVPDLAAEELPEGFRERLKWAVDNDKTFPDVALKLKGKLIYAHKVILAARSIVFRKKWDPTYGKSDDDVSQSHLDVSAESAATPPRSRGPNSPSLRGAMNGKKGTPTSDKKKKKSSEDSSDEVEKKMTEEVKTDPATGLEVIDITEDFNEGDFKEVLTYIYTGEITLKDEDHADRISSIGFEYLLDDLMRLCRTKLFPASLKDTDETFARAFRKLVGSPTGSDIFFVVKRKKLLGHRVMLYLCSSAFYKMLKEDPKVRYIEVRDVGDQELDVKTFIDYCRMLYCGFSAMPEHKEKQTDVAGLLALALHFRENGLISLLAASSVVNNDNVAQIYSVCTKFNLKSLRRTCLIYLLDHFGEIVQDKATLAKWSPKLIQEIFTLYRKGSFNWLDILWFAANTGDDTLKDTAVKELEDAINIDNVIPLLVASHHCGAKQLRSKCVDFILSHASTVEEVQRMQLFSDTSLTEVSGLSTSLNAEMAKKVSSQVSLNAQGLQKSKVCTLCATEFSFFGAKKNQCTLCKRAACNNCIEKSFPIPAVFGYTKPKPVCKSCTQMVGLLGKGTTPTKKN